MNAHTAGASRAGYSVSLQQAAEAIWGENFWGREKINPQPPAQAPLRRASGR